ncbi:hypothetical protein HBI74_051820 [Parastagonospora nodorum]|nr:hypothetical protein HBI74_051820 [Parastagonospora nodorum]
MRRVPSSHFTDFFTPTAPPLFRLPHVYSRVNSTAVGRRDSISPANALHQAPAADMNEENLNPHALPFRPGGPSNDARLWNRSRNENPPMPPHMPPMPHAPFGHAGAPWQMGFPPGPPLGPPPPPPFFTGNQFPHNDFEAHQHAHSFEQARAHHQPQWPHNYGPPMPHANFPPPPPPPLPYGQPPGFPPQFFSQHFPQQRQPPPPPRQPGYPQPHPAHFQAMQHANWPQGASTEDIQAPTQTPKKNKKSKAKAKAAANGDDLQDPPQSAKALKKGRYGDAKIMLPAPQPTDLYMSQASEEPSLIDPPGHLLVILDLNGTVLYRPNRNSTTTMIARPYLSPFLRYLFQNFKVMVWSSARPANVKALVDKALDKDLKDMMVATWARDTFGLSAANFNQNVQVYKNLRLIWSRDQIQQHHPQYEAGQRFGQHNTVLIDDSALKASAQPHNLLEIPEFEATPEQMEGDVLREVAGYLEVLRQQSDVSKFIRKEPFTGDGRWNHDWPVEAPNGGELKDKVTLKAKRQGGKSQTPKGSTPRIYTPRASTPRASTPRASTPRSSTPKAPVSNVTNSLSSVSLKAAEQAA